MRILLAIAVLFISFAANALSLDEARGSGKVKETASGYVTAVDKSPEVQALVSEINAKRKAAYKEISSKNGQPLNVVEQLAGEKLVKEHN